MKKLLFLIFMVMLLFQGCSYNKRYVQNEINIDDVKKVTIKALPSPPKFKIINKKEDIEKIINHINSIKKEKINQDNIKGWQFFIEVQGKKRHSITLIGNKINIDDDWYKINKDEIENFQDIYDNLNYKEDYIIK